MKICIAIIQRVLEQLQQKGMLLKGSGGGSRRWTLPCRMPVGKALSLTAACLFLAVPAAVQAADDLPGWKLINIDIDKSVSSQKQVLSRLNVSSDLQTSVNDIRLWSDAKGLKVLRKTFAGLRQDYPQKWLTFVGSGDFHHVSALLIESLPADARPVTVVQIDNHPDWFKALIPYHCGAWVNTLLRQSFVEKVIEIGSDSADLKGDQFWYMPFDKLSKGRITIYPLARQRSLVPLVWTSQVAGIKTAHRHIWGTELCFAPVHEQGTANLAQKLARELSGKNVYISIDKDVLEPKYAVADWDQGHMNLDELRDLIKGICASAHVVGADVCGETAPVPLHGLLKRIDSGRIGKKQGTDFAQFNAVNEETNLRIIDTFESVLRAGKQ